MTKPHALLAGPLLLLGALATGEATAAGRADEPPMVAGGALPSVEEQMAQLRRRPGREPAPEPVPPEIDPSAVPPPSPAVFPPDFLPVPDRWRIIDALGVQDNWWDPYNQNTLKGDRPVWGNDWFVLLTGISDTVYEPRSTPVPVGLQSADPGSNDVFGGTDQWFFAQTLIASASVIKGNTAYKPPDFEARLTVAYQYNYAEAQEQRFLEADPADGTSRTDDFLGVQEAFIDYHLRNVSERYDFDSIRVGIQPFSSDFRGFLFQDNQLGIRLFGNRDNNLWQYNLAAFQRIDKDTNSGLNDVYRQPRNDQVFLANLYRQDFPIIGLTTQGILVYNRNRDRDYVDKNDFPARPAELGFARQRDYDVGYAGLNLDGRIGWLNLTASGYYAYGENRNSPFSDIETDVEAYFFAVEPSVDFDWVRLRLQGLYASGDSDPYDGTDEGFDAIFENPQFAGADTSYWIRQQVPFIGGGFVGLSGRNAVLPALRSSKELGQSNFTNPGLTLLGAGADFDILPELRLSFNANYLRFNDTASLEAARQQGDISNSIGWDLSSALIWRPFLNQNVVFRLSGAVLLPGSGFNSLYDSKSEDYYYSVLGNLVLTY
jgi:hypothetical protein